MRKKTSLERLDDSIMWIWPKRWLEAKNVRRHYRWSPLIPIIMGIIGLISTILHGSMHMIGVAITAVGFVISGVYPTLGPIKYRSNIEYRDEYDIILSLKAYSFTGTTIASISGIGCFSIAIMPIFSWDIHLISALLFQCGFLIGILYSCLPTLYASWTTKPLSAE